ncbi:MAG: hypothetical protein EHM60_03505 [Lysobacterales bacterium]|jgi:hypothetical protein|nr:MAG: hypothetical protein EHM60_03505 [Xanthomonadales bacterium]
MNPTRPGLRPLAFLALLAAFVLPGCVVQDQRPMARVAAERATTEVAEDERLDVGVRLFDPNVPESEEEQQERRIFPEVRKAESRYVPLLIRDTLEGTGQWGQVRVLPREGTGMEVYVDGRIVESTGRELELDVTVSDATGRTWYRKTYKGQADTRAYKDGISKPRDPFENVYATIANDLLAARRDMSKDERVRIRQVADLRFATELAPYAFGSYLARDRKGMYSPVRLPAADDPVVQRVQRVRERDYALIDTLNEHYANFGANLDLPYTNWRKYSYEELEAEALAKREALTRQVLGAVAVVGGIMAGQQTNSSAGSAAASAAVIGGMYAFKSGLDRRAETKVHTESLKQLGESFQAEVQPMVVDVEGRTLELKGSAEEQYAEWRRLLRELYENETGLPATAGAAASVPSPRQP